MDFTTSIDEFPGRELKKEPMKTEFTRLTTLGLLLLAAPALRAQNTNASTNSLPLNQSLKYQVALENDRAMGERALLPPGLKEKLKLSDEQLAEFKPIEDDFAKTSLEYQTANQPRIEAAQDADRRARQSKDAGQIQAARQQMQGIWARLQSDRAAAVAKIKPLLTPAQLTLLEDPKNQWRENHNAEANDPSAN